MRNDAALDGHGIALASLNDDNIDHFFKARLAVVREVSRTR